MNDEVKAPKGKKKESTPVGESAVVESPNLSVPTPTTAVEVTPVSMTDGRIVNFTGKRKLNKDYEFTPDGVVCRFDFRNGETRSLAITKDSPLLFQFAGHGALQKVGDESAGEPEVDDMVIATDAMLGRLSAGEWGRERKTGDGFAGASIVIRAVMEVTGKDQTAVKAFLDKKLETTPGLTRAALYASFKNPTSKTAAIIQRLENEKLTKNSKVDTDELLAELG